MSINQICLHCFRPKATIQSVCQECGQSPIHLPKFIHDSDCCTFVGANEKYDFYFCKEFFYPTTISRYGSEGSEYNSGIDFALIQFVRLMNKEESLTHHWECLKFAYRVPKFKEEIIKYFSRKSEFCSEKASKIALLYYLDKDYSF